MQGVLDTNSNPLLIYTKQANKTSNKTTHETNTPIQLSKKHITKLLKIYTIFVFFSKDWNRFFQAYIRPLIKHNTNLKPKKQNTQTKTKYEP